MGEVIGEILPTAQGVAISPLPIIAAILMLLALQAHTASLAYLVGWLFPAGRALGLGALLGAANSKNLTLGLSAGVTIGSAGLSGTDSVIAVVVFAVLGSCTIAVPVIGYRIAGKRMYGLPDEMRVWLTKHNA